MNNDQQMTTSNDSTPNDGNVPSVIKLGDHTELDVSHLSPEQVTALQNLHAESMVELQRKALEKRVDIQTLNNKLSQFNESVRNATDIGSTVTITNVQEDTLGRTETIIGNSDHAKRGKMTNRQASHNDNTMIYVIVGVIAVIILAAVVTSGG